MGLRGPKPKRKEVAWSQNIAYALGLIATDGCLSPSGRHIELTSKDEEQLHNFMHCINKRVRISTKLSTYTGEYITRVQFSDVTLYEFLLSIGLTTRKTHTIGRLEIPDDLFFHFLRGHHDGDGSFYSYFDPRWKSSFMFYLNFTTASEAHVFWIRKSIERLCGIKGHIVFSGRPGHKIYTLRYAKADTLKLLEKMYPTTEVMCLSRKRLKIEQALRIVGKTLPKANLAFTK